MARFHPFIIAQKFTAELSSLIIHCAIFAGIHWIHTAPYCLKQAGTLFVDICWKAVPGNSNNNTKEMSTSLPWRYYLVFILYSLFCSAQRYSHMNAQMKLFIEVSSEAGIDFKPVFRRLTRAAPLRHSLQAPSSVHPAENTHGRLQWCWWTDRWGCKYTLLIVPTLKTRGMWQTIVTETSD